MQHCSQFQCCCLLWLLIFIANLITEALSCTGISEWQKGKGDLAEKWNFMLHVFFRGGVLSCGVSVQWLFLRLKWAHRAHMHPLVTGVEAAWARERKGCSDKRELLRASVWIVPSDPASQSPLSSLKTHLKTHSLKRSKRQSLKKM